MIVKNLEIKNLKNIDDFKADFEGGIYFVRGENEIGKSTLMDIIVTLFTGNRSANLLKQGKEKGYAKMHVGDDEKGYDVEIRFTEKNPMGTISVEQTGSPFKTNKISALEEIFQYQDFDAYQFTSWSETAEGRRKQVDAVKKLLPEYTINRLNNIGSEILRIKEERKEYNIRINLNSNKITQFAFTDDELNKFSKEISESEIYQKKENLSVLKSNIEKADDKAEELKNDIVNKENEFKELKNRFNSDLELLDNEMTELERVYLENKKRLSEKVKSTKEKYNSDISILNEEKQNKGKQLEKINKWLSDNKLDENELKLIESELAKAKEHNEKHHQVKLYNEISKDLKSDIEKKSEFDYKLESLENEKKEIFMNAEMPVPGLTFDENGLFLNGIPFKTGDISTSQELEVAVKLIMATNKKTKVFRIGHGNEFGSHKLKSLIDFAIQNGYQGFIEEVVRDQNELTVEKYTINEK